MSSKNNAKAEDSSSFSSSSQSPQLSKKQKLNPSVTKSEKSEKEECSEAPQQAEETKSDLVELEAKWKKHSYALKVHDLTTIHEIKMLLMQFTQVLPKRMKIVALKLKGGGALTDDARVCDLVLKRGHKFMMIGTPEKDIWVDPSNIDPDLLPEVLDDLDYDYSCTEMDDIIHSSEHQHKLTKTVAKTSINMIAQPRKGKKLLVLDLDYTLFDMKSRADNFEQLKRPFTDEFLEAVYPEYDIVVWSQTSWRWLELKLTCMGLLTNPKFQIMFVLDKTAMFSIHNGKRTHQVKALELIWRKFPDYYDASNSIHIDDLGRNFAMNPQNGLKISPYKKAHINRHTDRELVYLARYLVVIGKKPSLSDLSHSRWKKFLAESPENF